MPSDLVRTITLGSDGNGGLAKLLHEKGMKYHLTKR